ncbi:MAG: NAD-dependent epimerase/dehydratase family protein [Verrucomicrobia bacterium]|nr:NAD-dependent epimerase/dehydratase family protein [Verrucomicrobiota bacterium]
MKADAQGNFTGKQLVIFGCGYVGVEVARQAMARGLRVTALTRNPLKAAELEKLGVTSVVADLADTDWHTQVPGTPDFALNCVSSGGGGIEGYRRSYVEGMRSIRQWSERHGRPGTLVYTSSTSVYPQGDGVHVDELAATGADAGERPAALLDAERLAQEIGQRSFILRLAGIYGPGRHYLLEQVSSGEVAGRGDHRLNLAYRDDIAAAIWAVLAASPAIAGGIYNVADDGAATKGEVVAWLAQRMGLPEPHFTGQPAGGRRTVTPDRVIVNERLKRELGWRPGYPTFREGYAEILRAL